MRQSTLLFLILFTLTLGPSGVLADDSSSGVRWTERPQDQWPQIVMINNIEYVDATHPVAGCAFLVDTGQDTLAATAKHILTFFKSEEMNSVSFAGRLKTWRMFPKSSPEDLVIVDALINEDPEETIERVPADRDWLLFSLQQISPDIQPLEFRADSLVPDEPVYIVGWRYTDRDCTQRIYPGRYVRSVDGTHLIATEVLADNTMPGLSGAPVIDSAGRVIGLMSQKHGKMEKVSSTDYPRGLLARGHQAPASR